MLDRHHTRSTKWALAIPLVLAALVSLTRGLNNALHFGCVDLQWMGARLIEQHVDPWQEVLAHFPHHYPHFSEPNYLHLLYILLLPLGKLEFKAAEIVWTLITVCLSILCVLLLRHIFGLSRFQTIVVVCFLWMSAPFRVVIQVGQVSFVELLLLTLAYWKPPSAFAGLVFGASYIKYSFSPVAALLHLLRGHVRFLLCSILAPLLGLLIVWCFVQTPFWRLAWEPFLVSSVPNAVSPGFADLMTLSESFVEHFHFSLGAHTTAYGLALFSCLSYAFLLSRYHLSRATELTLVSISSLFFLKHLVYDYIFLVVLLCYALTVTASRIRNILFAGVVFFWFILPFWTVRYLRHQPAVGLGHLAINTFFLAALLTFTTYTALVNARRTIVHDGVHSAYTAV